MLVVSGEVLALRHHRVGLALEHLHARLQLSDHLLVVVHRLLRPRHGHRCNSKRTMRPLTANSDVIITEKNPLQCK